jgi:hypothetical protein
VEQNLDRLLNLGVIKHVGHADWAAPVMVVKKPDVSAWLCVDFSVGFNYALQVHQRPLSVPGDIFATLNGGSCILTNGLLQCISAGGTRRRLEAAVQHQHTPGCLRTPAVATWHQISGGYLSGNYGQYASRTAICNCLSVRHYRGSRSPDDHRRTYMLYSIESTNMGFACISGSAPFSYQ